MKTNAMNYSSKEGKPDYEVENVELTPELRLPLHSQQKIIYGYQNLRQPNSMIFSQGLSSDEYLRSKSFAENE